MKTFNTQVMLGILILGMSGIAQAGNFEKEHPRRAEVNRNIRRERTEINRKEKKGELTADQAKQDRQNLREIKKNEVAEVKANGGHLTKEQQEAANQKLRDNQKEIHSQVQSNHPAAPAPTAAQ